MNPEFRHLEDNAEPPQNRCEKCGYELAISDWPFCPHPPAGLTHHEFAAYFDYGLGEEITTRDQRRTLLTKAKAYARDGMREGDLSARKDRVEADRAERRREKPTGKLYF